MATWIAHLRVAEKILEKYDFDEKSFLIGNIGPDSGVPNEDWSNFDPPKKITHWVDSNGEIDSELFFDKYLRRMKKEKRIEEYSFLVGYYFHLLSDIEWAKMNSKLKISKGYEDELEKDPKFIWVIKEDWYGLDFLYLRENPNSLFFKTFNKIEHVPNYLDYFPENAFIRQTKYITQYYTEEKPNFDREFIYLEKEEMNEYVDKTMKIIEEIGKNKELFL